MSSATLLEGHRLDSTGRPRVGRLAVLAAVVGLLAGLAGAAFASITGEPSIERAIALEAAAEGAIDPSAPADPGGEAVVSRSHQRGVGLFLAYALTGAAFGALLAVAAHGLRRGRPDPSRRVLLAGAILAGSVTVVPWLKYPPNPPGVGDPATLARRQSLYVLLIFIAVVVGLGATIVARRLRQAGWPEASRIAAVTATIVVPLLAAAALLPGGPDASTVPASLVWRFRLASLGSNLVVWAVLSVGLSWLVSTDLRTFAARRDAVLRWTGILISNNN